jgi:hypothetical protein
MSGHVKITRTRREFLTDAMCGFGSLAMADLLNGQTSPAAAKAKSVIFLFMAGGPSQLETFDPKPLLNKMNGEKRPASFGEGKYQFLKDDAKLLGTKRTFKKHGQSGIEVSDLLPHIAECVDDMAIIRAVHSDMVVHSAAQYQLLTGRILPGFPSMGSWVLYGLGMENKGLPGYVVMPDPHGALEGGQPLYSNGFLPAVYQPTTFRPGDRPVLNLDLPKGVTREDRLKTLKLIKGLDRMDMKPGDAELEARIGSYDLAFKMQTEAPELFDISKESKATLEMYGVGDPHTDDYGRRLLLARRLVEKGVRFVCPVHGGGLGVLQWDAHDDIEENHLRMAAQMDKPVAALLKDLKQRGLLDSTLVLWGGEFGRTPESQGAKGRDHHNLAYTMWMAGGGVKGGTVVGRTDEIGMQIVEDGYHLRDVHTTMLHQLGLNQDALNYLHQGRRERLTEVRGTVIKQIV